VGEVNPRTSGGTPVVIYHAPGVYSCLAHLSPGTATVREGQHVRRGKWWDCAATPVGSATPHLHMQLQATAQLGAPRSTSSFMTWFEWDASKEGDSGEAREAGTSRRGDEGAQLTVSRAKLLTSTTSPVAGRRSWT